jgi:GT2 family glycosyltransferase
MTNIGVRMIQEVTGSAYNSRPSPRVCTVVLNYNNISDTIETLKSIYHLNYEENSIILIENSTRKEVIQAIRSQYPALTIIENSENLGYAGGNNVGLKKAMETGANYIFILNNDVILEEDVLQKLVDAMEEDPQCSACQPLIAHFNNMAVIWSAGTKMYFGYPRLFRKGQRIEHKGTQRPPLGLVGCALLIRVDSLRKIGLFDESLFLFQEETDWCIRSLSMGFHLLVASDAVVYHKVSETIGLFSKTYLYYIGRNWLAVARRHYGPIAYGYVLLTELTIRIPYYLYQLSKGGNITRIKYYLWGLKDGIRGVSGEKVLD